MYCRCVAAQGCGGRSTRPSKLRGGEYYFNGDGDYRKLSVAGDGGQRLGSRSGDVGGGGSDSSKGERGMSGRVRSRRRAWARALQPKR